MKSCLTIRSRIRKEYAVFGASLIIKIDSVQTDQSGLSRLNRSQGHSSTCFDNFVIVAIFWYSEIKELYILCVRKVLMPGFLMPYGG